MLEFIEDDFKKILYGVDKQLDYCYLPFVQSSKIARKTITEEASPLQSTQFQHHDSDTLLLQITQG